MKYRFLLAVCFSVAPVLPVQAQNTAANPNNAETAQAVGVAHWRIGSPSRAVALYIEAPPNLASGKFEWAKLPATVGKTKFLAQNEHFRVELVRGTANDYQLLRDAAFDRIGNTNANATGQNITVASYNGVRLENNSNIALVVKYGSDVWAIALLLQNGARGVPALKECADSLWFERREAPEWKDRAIGTTSFQADLPFELSPRLTVEKDVVRSCARWRNFWVDATEWRSGRTDLEGTITLQNDNFQKQPNLKDIRIKNIPRTFGFGFLEKGERGKFVQIDYTEGETKRRIYKLFSVAGTRVVQFQVTFNSTDSQHLLAAHRILATARLGWTNSENFTTQQLEKDNAQFESDSPFKLVPVKLVPGQGFNFYQGESPLVLALVMDLPKVVVPSTNELQGGANATIDIALKKIVEAAGGQLTNSRVEEVAGGIFPSRRIVFEGKIGNHSLNGDAAIIVTSHKTFIPFRISETASADWARRWVTTFRAELQPPSAWPKRQLGSIESYVPADSKLAPNATELTGSADGVELKIKVTDEKYKSAPNFHPGPNETSPITDSEIAAALGPVPGEMAWDVEKMARAAGVTGVADANTQVISCGNAFGVAAFYPLNVGQFTRLDVLQLHDGTRLWSCELRWNHNDSKSTQARDAILSSIRAF